jgi:hypothetical protein
VSLACPPQNVSAQELIELGYEIVDQGQTGRRSPFLERLRAAQTAVAGKATLATLLNQSPLLSEEGQARPV